MIAVVAGQQLTALRRQRVFVAATSILLLMTALAGVIGWSSHNTIVRVYDDATNYLAANGQAAPPNPFDLKPTLSLLANMTVYIPLIGALVAVIIGHLSMIDDKSDGIGRLLFSRPLSRRDYLAGKAAAAAMVLAVSMAGAAVLGAVSIVLVNGAVPTVAELGRIAAFYGLSWLYLMVFSLVGMVTVLLTTKRSLALLAAMAVWLVVTFAVPQFTSGLHPSAALNPIVDPVSTSQAFFRVTGTARPFSLVEQYKTVSGHILASGTGEAGTATALRTLSLVGAIGLLGVMAARLSTRHDYSKGSTDE